MNGTTRYGLKTVTTWRQTGRLRTAGLVAGCLACVAMVIVGCTSITDGTARVDSGEAPDYRASVQESISVRESESQVAITTKAVHTSCDALAASSVESIDAVNAYVDAINAQSSNADDKVGPAVDSLDRSAAAVAGSMSDPLPDDLASALNSWVDSARQLASVLSRPPSQDDFNVAIRQLNTAKTSSLEACNAAY